MTGNQEIIASSYPVVSYDPAQAGGDLSAVLVIERQNCVLIKDFSAPITFPRFRILKAEDLRNQEYSVQVIKLHEIVKQTRFVFQKDPIVVYDGTGNEALLDLMKSVLPECVPCKFSGENMKRPRSHFGRYRVLNKGYWVNKLALYLENDQIIVDSQIPQAKEIRKELEQFSGTVRQSGTIQYEAHGSGKDDFITCILLTLGAEPQYSFVSF